MRKLIVLLLFSSILAFAASGPAGKYSGTWAGATSDGGIKIELIKPSSADWDANVSFTMGGQEVKCKTASVKVDGSKLELVYDFNLGADIQLRSTVTGTINGEKMEGAYTTKSGDGNTVDQGTWKVALEK
jgi:hypothetical protein